MLRTGLERNFQSSWNPVPDPTVLKQIPVAAVSVEERMRQVDEGKVLELMQSYEEVGVINPISVDEELVLIAGAHRLEAAKNLG